jgi:hypothetical protein
MKEFANKCLVIGRLLLIVAAMLALSNIVNASDFMDREKIFVSFSTKSQNFKLQVLPVLKRLAKKHSNAIVVHGFASEEFCKKHGYSTDVNTALDKLFGERQLNVIGRKGTAGKIQREIMAQLAAETHSVVYVIGKITSGVAVERNLYEAAGAKIQYLLVSPIVDSVSEYPVYR